MRTGHFVFSQSRFFIQQGQQSSNARYAFDEEERGEEH
jgi:hypothetical protein